MRFLEKGVRLSLLLFMAGACAAPAFGQQVEDRTDASVFGYVRDATSGETLLLANVRLAGTRIGAATNTSGYYTIAAVEPGDYTLVVSYIGYRDARVEFSLEAGERRRLDVELVPEGIEIDEITVTADAVLDEDLKRVGVMQMQTELIKSLPSVLQPDVFRSVQLLPGVKAASDYSSGLYIRGGSPDQTLILLDRTSVYNPTHFFGFFSTFNPDAIKDVRLYKGGFPAEYGGRLGSVIDIYNKDGNRREYEGGLSLGLLSSRAIVEGPYSRGSWMLAVRRSTLEPLLAVLRSSDVEGIPDAFHFIDANGKVNLDLSADDRLSVAFYTGRDKLDVEIFDDARAEIDYGNRTLSADWSHLFSSRLYSNLTLTGSRYSSMPSFDVAGTTFEQDNSVTDFSAKADIEYVPGRRHALKAGFWGGLFTFRLRNLWEGEESLREKIESVYSSAYLQDTFEPNDLWSIRVGLRANYFGAGRYLRLDPRLSLEYRPQPELRLQAAVGRYHQFLTLITSELFSGFDTWLTTGAGVPPAYGDQAVVGLKTRLTPVLNLDVEAYYRTMRDLFELDPFVLDPAGLDYVDLFRFGEGYAYGVEVMLAKSAGRLNGFLAYTLGRTRRRFPNVPSIGEFRYYFPKYDRTHDLHAVANYDLSRTWRATAVWTYATGQPYSRPVSHYELPDYPFSSGDPSVLITHYDFRLPSYHRLDVGMARRGTFFGRAAYELQIQLINAYSRRNTWFYFYESRRDNTVRRRVIPQIPVPLPNIAFTLQF